MKCEQNLPKLVLINSITYLMYEDILQYILPTKDAFCQEFVPYEYSWTHGYIHVISFLIEQKQIAFTFYVIGEGQHNLFFS